MYKSIFATTPTDTLTPTPLKTTGYKSIFAGVGSTIPITPTLPMNKASRRMQEVKNIQNEMLKSGQMTTTPITSLPPRTLKVKPLANIDTALNEQLLKKGLTQTQINEEFETPTYKKILGQQIKDVATGVAGYVGGQYKKVIPETISEFKQGGLPQMIKTGYQTNLDILKGGGELAKTIIRMIPRGVVATGLSLQKKKEFIPTGFIQEKTLGKEPVKNIPDYGAEFIKSIGGNPTDVDNLKWVAGLSMVGADVLWPKGNTKKAIELAFSNIAKSKNEINIANNLLKLGIKDENLTKKLLPISKIEEVKQTISDYAKTIPVQRVSKVKPTSQPLAQEAGKYKSAEDFQQIKGIVPEWGTANQYHEANPFRSQILKMAKTKKFDEIILAKADKWDMEQVLKDKPAYLNDGMLKDSEVIKFAKKNNLPTARDTFGKLVVAKNKETLNAILNAKTPREIGLALGYKDIGVMGGGKPRLAKSQLTDFYNQAVKEVKKVKPLAQEVRKYKSAEEFVNTQATKEGVATRFGKIDKDGAYFSEGSSSINKNYFNKPTSELYDIKNLKIVKSDTKEALQVLKEAVKDPTNTPQQLNILKRELSNPDNSKTAIIDWHLNDEIPSIVNSAKKLGYDGIKVIETGDVSKPTSIFIWNTDKIKTLATKSQLTDFYNQAVKEVKEVKAPSLLETTLDIQAGTKAKQIAAELPPIIPPTELPPAILPRATKALPLKETGEQYTIKELSLDTLYQKTGIITSVAKESDIIAKEIPINPTKWNRFKNMLGKFTTSFKEKIISDWQRVKELKTEGMKLTNELTPYERRKLMAGRQTARLQRTEEVIGKIDKDILNTSTKLKIKDTELQNEVFDYLKARHAPERNAALGEKAAGITTKEAGEIITRLEKSPHSVEIKRIADDLQKFHNETLDILYQGGKSEGVIGEELYSLLKTKYKNHIPLQRIMETDDIAEVLSGRGLAVKGTGLKRAIGSEREVRDIMENIYTARTQAIQRVEKNIVDNETFNFVNDYIKTFPEQELFEIIKPQAIGKTFAGKIITRQINDPTILQFQRFGKPAYIKINDPHLAVALRGVNREQLPAVIRYIGTVTRWMSAIVTRYSAEFPLSNKIRDMQEAVVYMASQGGFKGAAKTAFRDPASINDVKNFVLGKETAGTKLYKQMIEDGGTTGGMALSTRKQVGETLKDLRSTNRNIVRKGFKNLAESVDKWNTVFEDSTRLSAYKTALESGMSRNKAAIIAKNVSIDFNEFGTWGPIVNSAYMFANASIQGSAKMIRAMKNPKVAAAVVGTVGTAVFTANSWNDRVDPEWRNKVSKWDKLNGLNIVIPGTEKFYYISIPVSWGLKPIKVAMEYGTDVLSGQTVGLGDATEGIFTALIEGYNPVGGTDLASALIPSPIDPFIDIARNRKWTGGKLRPDWNKYAPASTQYFKDLKDSTTGKFLIDTSKSVAEKTGGRIEISPADAEYVLQQITGGPGKFTGKVFNSISAIGKGESPEVRDIPFLSRVFRKTPEERFYVSKGETDIIKTLTEQERKRFYDKQEAEKVFEELKKMPVEQRKETYIRLKEEKPQIIERVDKIADDEEKNLTRLDRQILGLGVENGQRAKYLFKVFKSAEPQEKKELYQEYLNKGIISDKVREQLDYLFEKNN